MPVAFVLCRKQQKAYSAQRVGYAFETLIKKTMKKTLYLVIIAMLVYGCAEDKESGGGDEATGGIYGVITDKATGEPIRSAGVHLNPTGINTVTGSEGQYEFVELKAGDYTISVTKTGYTDLASYKITVAAGKTNKGDVQLEKLPPSLRVVNDKKQDIDSLEFGAATGDLTRSFNIFNDGSENILWEITETSEWITKLSRDEGTLTRGATHAVVVTIDRENLNGGYNSTMLQITSNNGSKQLKISAIGQYKVLPVLNTDSVTNITPSSAVLHGTITNPGIPAYAERGFVYSTDQTIDPTVDNTIEKITVSITSNINYFAAITELSLGQTYYVKAYAKNSVGYAYSTNKVSFRAETSYPAVTTQLPTNINIGSTNVTLKGNITNAGDPLYFERGFVYSVHENPTLQDIKEIVPGNSTGEYFADVQNLQVGITYNVRAYATNDKGAAYGANVQFLIPAIVLPEAYIMQTTAISADGTKATFNGYVDNVGNPAGIIKGFCYSSINQNPTLNNADYIRFSVTGNGNITAGDFTYTHNSLLPNENYFLCSYVITPFDTVYSGVSSFSTLTYVAVNNIGVSKQDIGNGGLNWTSANNLCENSTVGGYTDWRLPTIDELTTIYNNRQTIGKFQNVGSYWSSTLYSDDCHSLSSNCYYLIGFSYNSDGGTISYGADDGGYYTYLYARCVRTLP
jgi:hypothetical protein